jgi:hypothetical protein
MHESRGQLQLGIVRKLDDVRSKTIIEAIRNLTKLNREIWDFLPVLQQYLADVPPPSGSASPPPAGTGEGFGRCAQMT